MCDLYYYYDNNIKNMVDVLYICINVIIIVYNDVILMTLNWIVWYLLNYMVLDFFFCEFFNVRCSWSCMCNVCWYLW